MHVSHNQSMMIAKLIGLGFFLFHLCSTFHVYAQINLPDHSALSLTKEEKDFLANHPSISVGIMDNWPPITYVDAHGQRQGIDTAYVKLLNQRLNGMLSMTFGPFNENLEKARTKKLDALMDVTPKPEREEYLNFTKPYIDIPHVIVAPKNKTLYASEKDLYGKILALEKGFGNVKYFMEKYPEVIIKEYPDTRLAINAVARGEADAYAGNLAVAIYILENELITNLKIHGRLNKSGSILTIGVRKDWPEMTAILEKALASITEAERQQVVEKWVAIKYDAGINWKIIGPIVAVLIIIIAFVLAWNRRLKEVSRERERSEQKIKAMGEAMPDALIMIDGWGKVLFWNQVAEKLFGYTAAEAIGMDLHEMTVPLEAREKARMGISRFASTGHGVVFGTPVETSAINRAGKAFPVEVNLSPFKVDNKWFAVGTVRDITERKQMDEKLGKSTKDLQNQIEELGKTRKAMLNILEDLEVARKSSEATVHKLDAMSQAVNDALVMIDGQGKVLFWNQAAENMFGYTSAEVIGMDFHSMAVPAEDREKAHAGIKQFGATGQGILFGVARETTAINRTGQAFPVEINLSPFRVDKEWFAVGTVRDITERRRADALKVGKEVAEEAAARAEKARIEAERAQEELKAKVLEIERFNRLSLGREGRIIDLKKQVNALAVKAGEKTIYQEHELAGGFNEELVKAESSVRESEAVQIGTDILNETLDMQQFQLLLTDFSEAVGIAAAIIDLKGKVLAAARWQRACTDFHRVNEKTLARCIESDTDLALNLSEGKPFTVYRCKNGLTDAASPIIVFGRHIANVFVGQFFTAPPDLEFFRSQAEECGLNIDQYMEAISEVPIVNEDHLKSILGFLAGMAQIVASMSMESNRARQAEASNLKRIEESKREQAAAMSLAEDANQARLEIEHFKERLEVLVQERTDELRTSEERSRLFLESAGEGIFGVDANGQITFINPAALTMLGFTEEELRGRKVHGIIHHSREDGSKYPVEECPMHASYTKGIGNRVTDEVLWRKDGLCFPVEYSSTPIIKDGKVMGSVVTFRDITERKQAEKELKERMQDLERFSHLTINREEKMIKLKEEINILLEQTGKEKKYKIVV